MYKRQSLKFPFPDFSFKERAVLAIAINKKGLKDNQGWQDIEEVIKEIKKGKERISSFEEFKKLVEGKMNASSSLSFSTSGIEKIILILRGMPIYVITSTSFFLCRQIITFIKKSVDISTIKDQDTSSPIKVTRRQFIQIAGGTVGLIFGYLFPGLVKADIVPSITILYCKHRDAEDFEEIIPELDKKFEEAKRENKPLMIFIERAPSYIPEGLIQKGRLSRDVNKHKFTDLSYREEFLEFVLKDKKALEALLKEGSDGVRIPPDISCLGFINRMIEYFSIKWIEGYWFETHFENNSLHTYLTLLDASIAKRYGMETEQLYTEVELSRDRDVVNNIEEVLGRNPDLPVVVIRDAARIALIDILQDRGYKVSVFTSKGVGKIKEENEKIKEEIEEIKETTKQLEEDLKKLRKKLKVMKISLLVALSGLIYLFINRLLALRREISRIREKNKQKNSNNDSDVKTSSPARQVERGIVVLKKSASSSLKIEASRWIPLEVKRYVEKILLKELIEEFGQIKAIRIYFKKCSDEFLNKVYKDEKFAKNIIKDPLTGKRFDRAYRPKNRQQLVNWLARNLRKPLYYFKNLSSNQLWAMYEKNLIQNNFKKQLVSSIEWHRYRLIIKTKGNRKFLRLITIKRDDLVSAFSDFSSSAIVRERENSLIVNLSKNEFLEKYRQYYADLWIRDVSRTSSSLQTQNSFLEDVFRWLSDVEKIERGLNKIVKILKRPERIIEFEISIRMDKGEEKKFKAWRVVSNTALGPGKGGVRFDENVSPSEIKGLSLLMPLKCACVGLNLGGAKGGVRVNPRELSKRELALLSRGYVRGIYKLIGPYKDIPAPDLGTNSLIMSWFEDEYIRILVENQDYSSLGGEEVLVEFSKDFPFLEERIKNPANTPYLDKFLEIIEKNRLLPTFVLGAFTGKRIEKGGSYVREEATALGVYFATAKVLELMGEVFTLKRTLKNLRVVIQGYGNVGRNAAYIFSKAGAKVIGISTIEGGLYNPKGLDLEDIDRYIEKYSALKGYPKAQFITNEELLKLNTDILIPAACENQITKENAPFIETPLIIEAANHPVTYEAEKILKERGIFIVPDIIANPGGVIVSSFEWIQNVEGEKWEKITVEEMLREYIYSTVKEVLNLGKEKKISLREASYILALRRIRDAQFPQRVKLTRGFVPYTVEVLNQIVEKKKFKKFIENFEIAFSEKIEEIASRIEEKAFRSRESPLIVFVYGAVCIGKYTVAERIRKVLENRGKKIKHYSIDRNTQEGFLLLKEGYRVGKINPKELDILIVSGASLNEELVNSVAKKRRFSILCYLAPSLKLATKEPLVSVNLRLLRRLLEFKNKNKNPLDAIRLHIAERTCYIGIYPLWWKEKDIAINCYNPYELIPFKKYAGEILRESHIKAKEENDTRSIKKIKHLLLILQDLRSLEKEDEAFIPQDSLIRQFLPSASSGIDIRNCRGKIEKCPLRKEVNFLFHIKGKLGDSKIELFNLKTKAKMILKLDSKRDIGEGRVELKYSVLLEGESYSVRRVFLKIDRKYKEIVIEVIWTESFPSIKGLAFTIINFLRKEALRGKYTIRVKDIRNKKMIPLINLFLKDIKVAQESVRRGYDEKGLSLPPSNWLNTTVVGYPKRDEEVKKILSSFCVNIRKSEAEIRRYPSLEKVMERLSKVPPGIGHIYNVYKHSLVAVKILDLTGGEAEEIKEEFPKFYKLWKEKDFRLLKGAYEEIKKEGYLWLLRLATLLHDIGKLTQEEAKSKEYKELLKLDHPERGAILAEPVLEELGLNEKEKDFIIWLIRNHNYLNYFASTYIYQMDELALLDLVNKVEPHKYHTLKLTLLYLLSWADRVAMDPEATDIFGLYTHYERLSKWYKIAKIKVDELYKGEQTFKRWKEKLKENMVNFVISYYGESEATQIYLKLLLEYDLYDIDAAKISKGDLFYEITLTEKVLKSRHPQVDLKIFIDRDRHFERYFKIVVCLKGDRIGLLSELAGVFWLHGLDIKRAKIRTEKESKIILDTFWVRVEDGINLKELTQKLKEDLQKILFKEDTIESLAERYNREIKFIRKDRGIPTQIKFSDKKDFTVLEIKTIDRAGLIYIIATILKNYRINILKSIISTYGFLVWDTFYITEEERPLSEGLKDKLIEKLKILDKEVVVFEDLKGAASSLKNSDEDIKRMLEEAILNFKSYSFSKQREIIRTFVNMIEKEPSFLRHLSSLKYEEKVIFFLKRILEELEEDEPLYRDILRENINNELKLFMHRLKHLSIIYQARLKKLGYEKEQKMMAKLEKLVMKNLHGVDVPENVPLPPLDLVEENIKKVVCILPVFNGLMRKYFKRLNKKDKDEVKKVQRKYGRLLIFPPHYYRVYRKKLRKKFPLRTLNYALHLALSSPEFLEEFDKGDLEGIIKKVSLKFSLTEKQKRDLFREIKKILVENHTTSTLVSLSLSREYIAKKICELLNEKNLSKTAILKIFSQWREGFPERKITPIEILFSFPSFLVKELNLPFINFPSQNTALLVIDVQNDFCQRGEKFAYGRREIEKNRDDLAPIQYMVNKNLVKLIEKARQNNVNIVFIQAEYKENQFKDMPKLCIKGSEGWKFYKVKPELEKGEKVFSKNKYDAFKNQLLKEYLLSKSIKYILIAGVTTDNCIKAAFDSNLVKVKKYVIGDCVSTAGYKLLTSHIDTLKHFKEKNGLIWFSQISFSSSSSQTVSVTPLIISSPLIFLLRYEEMTKFYKISSGSSCLSNFSRLLKRLKAVSYTHLTLPTKA